MVWCGVKGRLRLGRGVFIAGELGELVGEGSRDPGIHLGLHSISLASQRFTSPHSQRSKSHLLQSHLLGVTLLM